MKKLFHCLVLLCALVLPTLASAQYTPYSLQIFQADSSGTFFWGRYWTPASPTDSYVLMYDGNTSQPKLGSLSSALSWDGSTLDVSSISQSQVSGLVTALNGKYNTPAGTMSQYVRGDGSLATFPTIPVINYSLPSARTLSLSTNYQASDPTKPAILNISPQCTAALTLSGGSTCSMDLRMHSSTVSCSTGTVVATWTNGNTGTLTIGLATNQLIGSPFSANLPVSGRFILCPTSGTWTVQATEQSVG